MEDPKKRGIDLRVRAAGMSRQAGDIVRAEAGRMAEAWRGGMTLREIGAAFGLSHETVRQRLRRFEPALVLGRSPGPTVTTVCERCGTAFTARTAEGRKICARSCDGGRPSRAVMMRGLRCYERRREGLTWAEIGAAEGVSTNVAHYAAHAYARTNGLAVPPRRAVRTAPPADGIEPDR